MYVIHSKKLVYLAQPRTASRSVRKWIEENLDTETVGSRPMWPPGYGGHHMVNLSKLKELREDGYRSFSCVRNHWDWMVSIYHWDFKGKRPTFEKYLAFHFTGPNTVNLFTIQEDAVVYGEQFGLETKPKHLFWLYPQLSDIVMKYEYQERSLRELFERPDLVLPRENVSTRLPYQTYYDEFDREHVRDLFRPEIQKFGYHFSHGGNDGEVGEAELESLGSPAGDDS